MQNERCIIGQKKLKKKDKFHTHYETFRDTMTKVESIWDGHLGRIWVAMRHIELTPNKIRRVNCVPFRAGATACEFKKTKIDRMLKRGSYGTD